ncbi:MAG: hypothetical protein ABIE23_01005 [archaeon]|nr:hypothetical protein [Candidatus Micrarchaeota archaeon]
MKLIREGYEKRTVALILIWAVVVFAYIKLQTDYINMGAVFVLGCIFSLAVLNKPRKENTAFRKSSGAKAEAIEKSSGAKAEAIEKSSGAKAEAIEKSSSAKKEKKEKK